MSYKYFFERYHEDIKSLHLYIEKHLRYLSELECSENEMKDLLRDIQFRTSSIIDKNHDCRTKEYNEFHEERVRIRDIENLSDEHYELGVELGYINEDNRKLKKKESVN